MLNAQRIEHHASAQPSPVPTLLLLLLLQVKEPVPLTIHHIPLAVTLALFQVAALARLVSHCPRDMGDIDGGRRGHLIPLC